MTENSLLTIGAFARSVGLTPSALRFYDVSGLLTPVVTDERTGYRYYDPSQRDRAVLVRQMRELDVPLTTMRAVLDGTPDDAEALLAEHAAALTERADRARDAIGRILGVLRRTAAVEPSPPTRLSVGGPELAAAVRQVAPFAAAQDDGAALDHLLLAVSEAELAVVGTDRYRLAIRELPVSEQTGPDRRIPIAAQELTAIIDWLRRRTRVLINCTDDEMIISDPDRADQQRRFRTGPDRFPDHRMVLAVITDAGAGSTVITDRIRLLELIAADTSSTIVLTAAGEELQLGRLNDPERHRVPAVCSGAPVEVAFAPELLASALQSSVGPDVLIDASPDRAAVIRSADQGGFTTLVMPRRIDGGGAVPTGSHDPADGGPDRT